MGYGLEFNCLLRIPEGALDIDALEVGKHYQLIKDGARLYPVDVAIEFCDNNYVYRGKVAVRKLTLGDNQTVLDLEVLKLFDDQERDVFTQNFIKAD